MAARSELIEAIVERYRMGCRDDKRRILDEFVAVTGYHRKHAIRCAIASLSHPAITDTAFAMAPMSARRLWCCGRHRSGCVPNATAAADTCPVASA